jgi:alpha-tubulin suppressor-like RCC1 family protein
MSGERTQSSGGGAASVAAGCGVREVSIRPSKALPTRLHHDDGLAVFSWGRGEDGQLGLGDTSECVLCDLFVPTSFPISKMYSNSHIFVTIITGDQDEPTYVDALRGVGVRQIACGSGHTVVLTVDGEVYTCKSRT